MKKLFLFLMIGVLSLGMVCPVFAEEVLPPPETEILPVSPQESVGGEEEDGSVSPPADDGGVGGNDDIDGMLPVDGSESVPDEVGEEGIPDDLEEFIQNTDEVHINADAVYLTNPEEPVTYAVGDVLSGGAFFDVSTDELGDVKIYIPIDFQQGSFAYDNNGNLVNIRASTITGYILDGTQYTVRWNSFNAPQYRLVNYSGMGSQYQDLTIYSVNDSNVQIVEDDAEVPLFPDDRYISLAILACLGVCMLCLFMKA